MRVVHAEVVVAVCRLLLSAFAGVGTQPRLMKTGAGLEFGLEFVGFGWHIGAFWTLRPILKPRLSRARHVHHAQT